MALKEVAARALRADEIPASIKDSFPAGKQVRLSEWEGTDKWVLVHDGKHIISHHGPKAATGTGNPDYTMLVGDEKEIAEEIKRLGLGDTPPTAEEVTP